jgi:hypothetical protein
MTQIPAYSLWQIRRRLAIRAYRTFIAPSAQITWGILGSRNAKSRFRPASRVEYSKMLNCQRMVKTSHFEGCIASSSENEVEVRGRRRQQRSHPEETLVTSVTRQRGEILASLTVLVDFASWPGPRGEYRNHVSSQTALPTASATFKNQGDRSMQLGH